METEIQLESNLYPIAPSRNPTLTKISSYKLHCNSSMFSHFFRNNHKYQKMPANLRSRKKNNIQQKNQRKRINEFTQLRLRARIGSEPQRWSYTPNVQKLAPEGPRWGWTPCWEAKMIHLLFYCGYTYPCFIPVMHLVAPGNAGHVGTVFFLAMLNLVNFAFQGIHLQGQWSYGIGMHWALSPTKGILWAEDRLTNQEVPLQTPHGIWDILRKPHFPHATSFGGVLVWWIRFHYLESLSRARDGSPQITGDGSFRAFCFWCSCSLCLMIW